MQKNNILYQNKQMLVFFIPKKGIEFVSYCSQGAKHHSRALRASVTWQLKIYCLPSAIKDIRRGTEPRPSGVECPVLRPTVSRKTFLCWLPSNICARGFSQFEFLCFDPFLSLSFGSELYLLFKLQNMSDLDERGINKSVLSFPCDVALNKISTQWVYLSEHQNKNGWTLNQKLQQWYKTRKQRKDTFKRGSKY